MDVFDNTPAQRQGVLAEDKILKIATQSTTNMTLDEAVDLMRGAPKTLVTITVQTSDNPPRTLTLTREEIPIRTFFSKLIPYNNKNFGVIQIKSFQDDTFADLTRALEQFKSQTKEPLAGLILDLRDDPGGLLTQAVLVADKFLSTGDIVYTVGPNNTNEEVETASAEASDEKAPMIVLINAGSASASEIVAGALKNNNRALILGQRSFGKGSVQALLSLRDNAMLKLTIAQYLTPGRESIQAVGIHPDIHLFPALFGKDRYNLIEDLDFSEEKLESHLSNTPLTKSASTTPSLSYYEEAPEKPRTQYPKELDATEYPIQLALRLLDAMPGKSREEDLKLTEPVLKKAGEEQDALIAEKFKERNIDWSQKTNTQQPKLVLHHTLTDETGKTVTEFEAGVKTTVKLTAKNTGTTPLHRLLVDCEAFNPLLDHQEFVFGLLNPGQEASAQVVIDVPKTFSSFSENVQFVPYLDGEKTNLTAEAPTEFVAKKHPRFAYSYSILDGQVPNTTGNQNGIPEKGEQVIIKTLVKNISAVPSQKTVINIQNKEGEFVFLKKAREDVGVVNPQQTATAGLAFDINENFTNDEFKLNFFVIDRETDENLLDTIVWNKANQTTATPAPDSLQIAPEIVVNAAAQHPTKNTLSLNFTVNDDQKIKDIAIFAKGKKKAYINLEELGNIKTKNILQEITLEKEVNAIEIEARDERDLRTQKTLIVVPACPACDRQAVGRGE
jgi:carboxyl-terminal processing protease